MENITLLKLASAMARHGAARHNLIAQNVANADTPGYRARDVQEFSAMVNEGFTARATRPEHVGRSSGGGAVAPEIRTLELPESPNGNSVTLEDQALRAVEAQGQYALALTVYSKAMDILRIGLGRNR